MKTPTINFHLTDYSNLGGIFAPAPNDCPL